MNKFLWLLCGAALVLVACATNDTEVVSVWKDETKRGKINKVFVLAVVQEPSYRRSVEYGIAERLNISHLRAIPTLDSFPNIDDIDKTVAAKMIKEFGIDSILLVRLVNQEVETTYVSGTSYYDGFYGNRYAGGWHNYYGGGYNRFMTPGYTTETYISTVETAIFDITTDKILWTTLTKTKGNVVPEAIKDYLQTINKSLAESELF